MYAAGMTILIKVPYLKYFPLCFERHKETGLEKLMATLHDKERCVVHYRMLKKALDLGLRLKKIHRGLKFSQAKWMELYIMRHT